TCCDGPGVPRRVRYRVDAPGDPEGVILLAEPGRMPRVTVSPEGSRVQPGGMEFRAAQNDGPGTGCLIEHGAVGGIRPESVAESDADQQAVIAVRAGGGC